MAKKRPTMHRKIRPNSEMEKYEKIRSVGRGSFGNVLLYQRKSDKKSVIIKQIPVDDFTKEEKLATLNEGKVLAMLDHPFIVEYFESFIDDQIMTIVMEYVPGGTLLEFLVKRKDNFLEEKEILMLFSQIVLALHYVHSNQILHRDLKTQNILISVDRTILKLCDFGISKILSTKTEASTVLGTPSYISPERCEGKLYNEKSDIWALGCILYEMTTLKRAFQAESVTTVILKIMQGITDPVSACYSNGLKNLITSMLYIEPNKRPTTNELMAHPLLINILYNLYTDAGKIPSITRPQLLHVEDISSSNATTNSLKPSLLYLFTYIFRLI